MERNISIIKIQNQLQLIWYIGAAVLFLILVASTFSEAFVTTTIEGPKQQADKVWAWFIPLICPTLILIAATAFANAKTTGRNTKTIKTSFGRFVQYLSLFYLLMLTLIVAGWPLLPQENPLDTITLSNYFLGPIQGLVVTCVGNIFIQSRDTA